MIINPDPIYNAFIARLNSALFREKFHREEPLNNTPTNTPSARKFYFLHGEKNVFVCYPDVLFGKIILTLQRIAKETENSGQTPDELLQRAYLDEVLNHAIQNYSWSKTYDEFKENLKEESYIYFDDNENQYYFNLFRFIEKGEFTGGVLHSLTRHYKNFNKFTPRSNGDMPFELGSLLVNIILCCLDGDYYGKLKFKTQTPENYQVTKRIKIDSVNLFVGLYWDNWKQLFFLNTAYISKK